ncbi:MAG: DUF202 domain-containing protein [Novosphingobium sp.]|nr:DUF202 domain-containing protein [Novosphingobium sp.]MCP5401756.1 DUF202 domain-containing protein [Novosphingobium sp.]
MTRGSTESEQLAEDRTDLAEDRTVMATERTFAGWMRTAFAAIGIGIAFRGLFGELEPPWLARAIATVFIVLGAVLAIGAERRAAHSFSRLSAHKVDEPQVPRLRWIAYSIAGGGVVLAAALWVMH